MWLAVQDVAITKGHDGGLCPYAKIQKENVRFPLVISILGPVFWSSPDGFSGPESCAKFAMCTFKKYNKFENDTMKLPVNETKLTELRTMILFNRFWFEYLILGPVSYQNFWETNPGRQNPWPTAFTITPDFIQNNLDSFTFVSSLDVFPASSFFDAFVLDIVASFSVAFPPSCFIKTTIHWSLISYIIWATTTKK